jgi:hypothetical protein
MELQSLTPKKLPCNNNFLRIHKDKVSKYLVKMDRRKRSLVELVVSQDFYVDVLERRRNKSQ